MCAYNTEWYKERFKKYPWEKTYKYIHKRCTKKIKPKHYENILNEITKEELKILWFRDKAYDMKKPSIDRIDSKNNYTLDNCRYLELSENSRIGGKSPKINRN